MFTSTANQGRGQLRYSVALKHPAGLEYSVPGSGAGTTTAQSDINIWIQQQLFGSLPLVLPSDNPTFWYIVWNDQPAETGPSPPANAGPSSASASTAGHSKGILMVRCAPDRRPGVQVCSRLLVHSIPRFPAVFDPEALEISAIPEAEQVYGQSLLCISATEWVPSSSFSSSSSSGPRLGSFTAALADRTTLVGELVDQIQRMQPHVLMVKWPNWPTDARMPPCAPVMTRQLLGWREAAWREVAWNWIQQQWRISPAPGSNTAIDLIYLTKPRTRQPLCIYQYLVTQFGGPCWTQSWVRDVASVSERKVLHVVHTTSGKTTQDHAKWAISAPVSNARRCWVWIGDLNHAASQTKRGGGGVVVLGDQRLWDDFCRRCVSVETPVVDLR